MVSSVLFRHGLCSVESAACMFLGSVFHLFHSHHCSSWNTFHCLSHSVTSQVFMPAFLWDALIVIWKKIRCAVFWQRIFRRRVSFVWFVPISSCCYSVCSVLYPESCFSLFNSSLFTIELLQHFSIQWTSFNCQPCSVPGSLVSTPPPGFCLGATLGKALLPKGLAKDARGAKHCLGLGEISGWWWIRSHLYFRCHHSPEHYIEPRHPSSSWNLSTCWKSNYIMELQALCFFFGFLQNPILLAF